MVVKAKDVFLNILKTVFLIILLVVLFGWLAHAEKLPALFSDEIAAEMKNYSDLAIAALKGEKLEKTEDEVEEEISVIRNASFFYKAADRLFMDGYYHTVMDLGNVNAHGTREFMFQYEGFLRSFSRSPVLLNFVNSSKSQATRFELKFFAEKYLKENLEASAVSVVRKDGVVLFAASKLPLKIPTPEQDKDFSLVPFSENGKNYLLLQKIVEVPGGFSGYLQMVYQPGVMGYLSLSDRVDTLVLLMDTEKNKLVYSAGAFSNPKTLDVLSSQLLKQKYPLKLVSQGAKYRAVYVPGEQGLLFAYLYRPVPGIKIAMNSFLYVLAGFLAFIFIRLMSYLYKQVFRKRREKKLDKEGVITGTVAEMVKALKHTADVTAQIAESSKDEIGMIQKTIDRIDAGHNSAEDDDMEIDEAKEWDVMNT